MGKTPLVTVQLPTWNRPRFAERAIEQIFAQKWPADRLELVIVDDSDPWKLLRLPRDTRIQYFRLTERQTIGEKRNLANRHAQGDVIVHWDDDDFYSPRRLIRQLEAIVLEEADLTGFGLDYVLTVPDGRFWRFKKDPSHVIRGFTVHDGTIAYRRDVWKDTASFPASSLGEQTVFTNASIRWGVRIHQLHPGETFVYVRHGGNSWKFNEATRLQEVAAPRWFSKEDLAFYRMAVDCVA